MDEIQKFSILTVDDDPDILRIIEFILQQNYNVFTANSGNAALKILNTDIPDLILLDIQMPWMNGYELCATIQENDELSTVPIIFLTALRSEHDKVRAFSLGAVDFISKPVGRDMLLRVIEKHINSRYKWNSLIKTEEEKEKLIIEGKIKKTSIVKGKTFTEFKTFLFDLLNLSSDKIKHLINIRPSEIYSTLTRELFITNKKLVEYISTFMEIEYISDIEDESVNLGILPATFCKKNLVVPIKIDKIPAFIITNPFDMVVLDTLNSFKYNKYFLTELENIEAIWKSKTEPKAKPGTDISNIEKRIQEHYEAKGEYFKIKEGEEEILEISDDSDEEAAPVIMLVNTLIENAYLMGASDLHIEPYEKEVIIRYRIDGEMSIVNRLTPQKLINPVVSRIKIMSNLNISEKRLPQDGRIIFKKFTRKNLDFDLRVSTAPMNFGEKVVMRIIDKQKSILPLERLGLSDKNLKIYRKKIKSPYGMILHVGPTGAGKSMTLYAALNELNNPGINIQTAEDPIEYTLPGINQMQMHSDIGLTFSRALRTFLRQDPDIILVGEIRDRETANIAVEAALTGHLLLSTLHTNDAASTITRFIEMGIEPFMISSSIILICAQRLIRCICDECKEEYQATLYEKQLIDVDASADITLYRGNGCNACNNSGYNGRTGIHEILVPNHSIRQAINRQGINADELKAIAVNECNMTTLYKDAIEKAFLGITSLEEVLLKTRKDE